MPRDVTVFNPIFSNHTTHSRPLADEQVSLVAMASIIGLFGSSIRVKVLSSYFLLGLTHTIRYLIRPYRSQSTAPPVSTNSHPASSWVPNHIPRLRPTTYNLTTGCDLQDDTSRIKKRILVQDTLQAQAVEIDRMAEKDDDHVDHDGLWLFVSDNVSSAASEADCQEE